MNNDENKIKHLEFIQNIITRMNTNSFQIKIMSITIIAALITLYASSNKPFYLLIPLFSTFIFWFLDAFYLQQERKFRGLYNDVAGLNESELKVDIKLFDMNIKNYVKGKYSLFKVFWSKTIWPLYLFPMLILLLTLIINIKSC